MLRLYNSTPSGNCYKVRLLLAQLERPFETVEIDVLRPDSRPTELLAHNPMGGRVPVLELEDGRTIVESNAILWHLADGTDFLPSDGFQRIEVLRWLFFEQNFHEPNIAVSRFLVSFLGERERFAEVLDFRQRTGHAALAAMETCLKREPFFVGGRYSIADIALYAYTHVAGEGEFDLEPYPAVRFWLDRVREQPGHVPMMPD